MTMMRYVTPTLDNMSVHLPYLLTVTNVYQVHGFVSQSCSLLTSGSPQYRLAWVDETYYKKHKGEDQSTLRDTYYPNLRKYATRDGSTHSKSTAEAVTMFLMRFGKKAGLSLAVFALSYIPYVGRLVLPAASFYTFQKVVGLGPAGIIFGTGIFLPRRYLIIFLQSYFASRSLTRELVCLYPATLLFSWSLCFVLLWQWAYIYLLTSI